VSPCRPAAARVSHPLSRFCNAVRLDESIRNGCTRTCRKAGNTAAVICRPRGAIREGLRSPPPHPLRHGSSVLGVRPRSTVVIPSCPQKRVNVPVAAALEAVDAWVLSTLLRESMPTRSTAHGTSIVPRSASAWQ
jgi:hypothetical protein